MSRPWGCARCADVASSLRRAPCYLLYLLSPSLLPRLDFWADVQFLTDDKNSKKNKNKKTKTNQPET